MVLLTFAECIASAPPQIIMMQAPAAAPAPAVHVTSSPVMHVHTTNVNTSVVRVRVRRGCLGSLIHTIFVLVAIVIFLVGILALVGYLASRK